MTAHKFECPECKITSETDDHRGKFCSRHCAMIYRHRQNPSLRHTPNKSNSFKITREVKGYIDGLLLSDASIPKGRTDDSYSVRLFQTFSTKFKEWAYQIRDNFKKFGIDSSIYGPYTNDKGIYLVINTKRYPQFTEFRKRWHSNGIKKVPDDLEFTEDTFTNWHLGDGCRKEKGIAFATDGFDNDSRIRLKDKLKLWGFDVNMTKRGQLILTKHEQMNKLLNLVRERVPNCFNYKVVSYD